MIEYYLAFSIAGTDCFITANIRSQAVMKNNTVKIGDFTFEKGYSRTQSRNGATKLLWNRLKNASGHPLKDPSVIHALFVTLGEAGWAVDDAAFIRRHKLEPRKVEPTAAPIENEAHDEDAVFMEGARLAASRDTLPFGPSPEYLNRVEKHDPELAAKLRAMPVMPTQTEKSAPVADTEVKASEESPAPDVIASGGVPTDFVKDVQAFADGSDKPDDEMPRADDAETDSLLSVKKMNAVLRGDAKAEPENSTPEKQDDSVMRASNVYCGSIRVVKGDIAALPADAIVNAANSRLIPGGGVDGALNRAAGPELAVAMRSIGECQTGGAVVTEAFGLPAKYVIHAVGPIYDQYPSDKAKELLRAAYHSAFAIAARKDDVTTVNAPLLSTGVYGYPLAEACAVAVGVAREFNSELADALDITFVAFDDAAYEATAAALAG